MTLQVDLVEKFQWVDGHADLWPWFSDADLFARIIQALAAPFASRGITKVVSIESRAFLLAGAVARELRAGAVPIRKRGAVFPGPHYSRTTSPDWQGRHLELLLQRQSLRSTDRLLLVDDWIETGGQVVAAIDLVIEAGA
jgi:adenine phosphoribosyltransferase